MRSIKLRNKKGKKYNKSSLWLACGITLATATQLRLPGLPIGPGETMLAIWIAVSFLSFLLSPPRQLNWSPVAKAFLRFWLISFCLLTLGFVFAVITERSPPSSGRDALAFGLIAIFCFLLTIRTDMESYLPSVAKFVLLGTVLPLFFMFSIAQLGYSSSLAGIRIWPGTRFIGWANNPNQIGMLMSMAPFWAIYWLMDSRRAFERALYFVVMMSSLMIGFASLSDSFIVSMLAGFFTFIGGHAVVYFQEEFSDRKKRMLRFAILCIGLPILFLLATRYNNDFFSDISVWALSIYEDKGQGETRLLLWQHGIEALAISPFFGLGPGAHSGLLAPFQDGEVHNTFLDWATNTGVFGLALYIGLLGRLGGQAWKKKNLSLLAAIVASSAFSLFNYTIRHPFFWCYLLAISTINLKEYKLTAPALNSVQTNLKRLPKFMGAHKPRF